MPDQELERVASLAASRGLASIACDGLATTREWFSTPRLDATVRAIRAMVPHAGGNDARVIPGRWAQADIVRHDLQSLTTWSARGRLVREHLFPPSSYIRGKYGVRSPLLLPALYAWRIVSGAPRWLRRNDAAG